MQILDFCFENFRSSRRISLDGRQIGRVTRTTKYDGFFKLYQSVMKIDINMTQARYGCVCVYRYIRDTRSAVAKGQERE